MSEMHLTTTAIDCAGLVDGDDSEDRVTCRERHAFCNYDFQCCSNTCFRHRCKWGLPPGVERATGSPPMA